MIKQDTRKIAYFTYANVLSFEKWGFITFKPKNPEHSNPRPEHLVTRLRREIKATPRGWYLARQFDLLSCFGTPLGEAVESYDEYLAREYLPTWKHEPRTKPRNYAFNSNGPEDFKVEYFFPNGWGLSIEPTIEDGALISLIQEDNPDADICTPDWWPEEKPKDPADLFELVKNAPKSEGVAE